MNNARYLIGLGYAMLSINLGVSIIGNVSCAIFHWAYYTTKSVLVFISSVRFIIVSRWYKYRKLNEDIDVNIRQEIEDAFECNFDREFEFEQEKLLHENDYIVTSTKEE